jgi:hypothetical protein
MNQPPQGSRARLAAIGGAVLAGVATIALVLASGALVGLRAQQDPVIAQAGGTTSTATVASTLLPAATAPATITPVPATTPPPAPPSKAPPPPAPPKPRAGGKPGAGNTGVPPGTQLTVVNGDQTYSNDNQVISGLDIRGFVQIRGKNVTIKNSIIRGRAGPRCNSAVIWVRADAGASATIQDSEIAPSHPHPCLDGIWAVNTTLLRMNIHGAVDGIKAHDNVTVQDSWVHDLSWFASDPNQGGGETHNDAVQTWEGNRHIVLRHNTLHPGPRGNAAYQVTQDGGKIATDLRIEGNWLDGGGCTLNFAHKGGPTPMTGIYVVGNRFGRNSTFRCPILVSTQTQLSQNSGNVWDDNGQPIPPPQRHD